MAVSEHERAELANFASHPGWEIITRRARRLKVRAYRRTVRPVARGVPVTETDARYLEGYWAGVDAALRLPTTKEEG